MTSNHPARSRRRPAPASSPEQPLLMLPPGRPGEPNKDATVPCRPCSAPCSRQEQDEQEQDSFSFCKFQRIADINAWLARLADAHPGAAQVVDGGRSFEGRPIRGVRLFPGHDKPRVLIEAGMHAQEWITTSTACWVVDRLLRGCSAPASPSPSPCWRQEVAERFEWHVFPNVNPDGYEYSFLTVEHHTDSREQTTWNFF
ncbi:Zinc carboxypeptidase A 1 [Frankliniella fusca]|uniref:Zinc carboxypeptidase A 1 n=1 Tax=Frankliniella fusca TaxID=407009 RepID=A0AAE1L5H2_9NEOP|nr:Zinc carboxypeptidase A 1 [Frankliniella fusca]